MSLPYISLGARIIFSARKVNAAFINISAMNTSMSKSPLLDTFTQLLLQRPVREALFASMTADEWYTICRSVPRLIPLSPICPPPNVRRAALTGCLYYFARHNVRPDPADFCDVCTCGHWHILRLYGNICAADSPIPAPYISKALYNAAHVGCLRIVRDLCRAIKARFPPISMDTVRSIDQFANNCVMIDLIRRAANSKPNVSPATRLAIVQELFDPEILARIIGEGEYYVSSALYGASRHRDPALINYLEDKRREFTGDTFGSPAWDLNGAARGGHRDIIDALLARSATVRPSVIAEAARHAARGGHLELVKHLASCISPSASPAAKAKFFTSVAVGANRGLHLAIRDYAIAQGSEAPSHAAAREVRALFARGRHDIADRLYAPLMRAAGPGSYGRLFVKTCSCGHHPLVRALLNVLGPAFITQEVMREGLSAACLRGHWAVCRALTAPDLARRATKCTNCGWSADAGQGVRHI